MKAFKQRFSILIAVVLIFQILTFGIDFNNVYAQNIDSEAYLKKSLNNVVLTKNSDIDDDFKINSIVQEKLNQSINKNETDSVRSMSEKQNEDVPVISFNQVVQCSATTEGALQVYLLEQQQGGKITVFMDVPKSQDINYDLYLYKNNFDTGELDFVAASGNGAGVYEQVSAICDPGVYVIGVHLKELKGASMPCAFIANSTPVYSSNEPNDKINQAKEYTVNTFLRDSIDNSFDEDYYYFQVEENGQYQAIFKNIPESARYHASIYDTSLNHIAGYTFDLKNNTVNFGNLEKGVYILMIASESGFDANKEYEFKLQKKLDPNSVCMVTHSGQFVELTEKALYINGIRVDMSWGYRFSPEYSDYTRDQKIESSNSSTFDLNYLFNGTYSGPQSVRSDDCIMVFMNHYSYMYFYKKLISGGAYDFVYLKPSETVDYRAFYVDVKTGKAIDTEMNWYSWGNGMPQTFTQFN